MTGGKVAVLKEYFGFDGFRTGQEEVIDSLLEGRDAVWHNANRRRHVALLSDIFLDKSTGL